MTQPTLLPIVFQRQIASPLDVDTVFSNTFNRNAYLTSPRRYAGQIVSDLEANAIFVLDSTRTTWLSAGSGGSGSSTLHGLTDVNVTEGVGIDGQYLKYDNATGKWVANTVSATVNTGNITFNNTTISTSLTGANINLLNSTGNTNIIGTSPDYPYAIMTSITVNSSGLFVAVGYDNNTYYPLYATSTDGITWTNPALMNGSTSYALLTSVTVNSAGLFVAIGYDNNTYPLYATSSDGTAWTTPALMNDSTSYAHMQSITVNSAGLFVAVGFNNNNYPLYATSADGTAWTTPALMNGSTSYAQMNSVTVNSSGLFIAVGIGNNDYPLYATSSDGSNWTTPAVMNGSTSPVLLTSVTVNSSGLFVAVGLDGNSGYPLYATSSDGSNWTTPAVMNGSTSIGFMTSVTVNSSGLFIAVGFGQVGPVYAKSSDGSNWTTPALINSTTGPIALTSVTVNSSGLFVAIGDEFSNFYLGHTSTTDGSTWSALTFNVTPRLPAQVNITAGNNTWQFTKSGNISLPLNTSSINYPNGYPYGGVSTLSALTDVNVAESAGIDGQYLKYDNATSKWIANTVLATHPIAFFFTTTPGANETLLIYNTVSNIDIQTNFNGFQCSVGTPPSGTFVLSIYKNTTQIGTITIFSNGYSQGSTSDSTVFVPGDTLLANVSISDAAIQNVGITFKGITA